MHFISTILNDLPCRRGRRHTFDHWRRIHLANGARYHQYTNALSSFLSLIDLEFLHRCVSSVCLSVPLFYPPLFHSFICHTLRLFNWTLFNCFRLLAIGERSHQHAAYLRLAPIPYVYSIQPETLNWIQSITLSRYRFRSFVWRRLELETTTMHANHFSEPDLT